VPVERHPFSPVRSHSENGFDSARMPVFPGAHRPYDYNEVFIR